MEDAHMLFDHLMMSVLYKTLSNIDPVSSCRLSRSAALKKQN